MHVALLHI